MRVFHFTSLRLYSTRRVNCQRPQRFETAVGETSIVGRGGGCSSEQITAESGLGTGQCAFDDGREMLSRTDFLALLGVPSTAKFCLFDHPKTKPRPHTNNERAIVPYVEL